MEGTVPAERPFPYANWGPWAAVLGVLLALVAAVALGAVLSIPALIVDGSDEGKGVGDAANALAQLGQALGFVLVPFAIAARRGASVREASARLGLRRFRPSALKWMAAAVGAYLLFAIVYVAIFGEPKQDDIAEKFGALPVQVLLIAIAAPISPAKAMYSTDAAPLYRAVREGDTRARSRPACAGGRASVPNR